MNAKHLAAEPMGQVIQFPGRQVSDQDRTAALLRQAEQAGHRAATQFATCREAMDWARSFHERCNDAINDSSLDDLIRTRDALARDWAERCQASLRR